MKNTRVLFIHSITLIALILPFNLLATVESNPSITNTLPAYSTQYNVKQDAFKDGAAAVKLATSTNRRILIELGGDWCTWCKKMDVFF